MILTANLPDKIDAAHARWSLAYGLYKDGSLTLEEAASVAGIAPTYFKMKLEGRKTGLKLPVSHVPDKPFDVERMRKLAEEIDIQESWEELVAMIGK